MAEEFVSPIDMLLDENNNDNIKRESISSWTCK